ncbi:hypothetical protein GBA65_07470 [Rubrobacter marinus]|uniref:Uncharacterized protein n=1 Tax=Rubrobacter marinus TaxID=2653852 RepID=A0A6G8PW11_9ACTN|nr:hypothetical protein [Rubrobacter marinus]QIN78389.1 hypothetical protein GBA65_07470 [Rubrobacter marinus]
MLRLYVRVAAVALLMTGVVGFSNLWGLGPLTGFYHVGVGLLFAYAGFLQRDVATVRHMVGGLGVLLLVVKLASFPIGVAWFGSFDRGPFEATCLVLGLGSVLAARYLSDGTQSSGGSSRDGRRS